MLSSSSSQKSLISRMHNSRRKSEFTVDAQRKLSCPKLSFLQTVQKLLEQYIHNMFVDFQSIFFKRMEQQQKHLNRKIQQVQSLLIKLNARSKQIQESATFTKRSAKQGQKQNNFSTAEFTEELQQTKSQPISSDLEHLSQVLKRMELSVNQLYLNKIIADEGHKVVGSNNHNIRSHQNLFDKEYLQINNIESMHEESEEGTQAHQRINSLQKKINLCAKQKQTKNTVMLKPETKRYYQSGISTTHESRNHHRNLFSKITSRKIKTQSLSCPKLHEISQIMNQNLMSNQQDMKQVLVQHSDGSIQTYMVGSQKGNKTKRSNSKLPLINKTKSVVAQLVSFVRDQSDANLVRFHLKKALRNIDSYLFSDPSAQKLQTSRLTTKPSIRSIHGKGLVEIGSEKMLPKYIKIRDQSITTKRYEPTQKVPEYFGNAQQNNQCSGQGIKNMRLSEVHPEPEVIGNNLECSIQDFLPTKSKFDVIKKNQILQSSTSQRKKVQKESQHAASVIPSTSRSKGRYFQRKSTEIKGSGMLKNKQPLYA